MSKKLTKEELEKDKKMIDEYLKKNKPSVQFKDEVFVIHTEGKMSIDTRQWWNILEDEL